MNDLKILKIHLKIHMIHVIKHSERVKNTFSSLECGSNNKELFILLIFKMFIYLGLVLAPFKTTPSEFYNIFPELCY